MSENWTVIDALRYSRHDWLNRLQIIKGNLSLGKTEQARRIMDEIVLELQHEAMLSNLGLPRFAELLLTHNWGNHRFQIEYELLNEPKNLLLDDQQLTRWMGCFFKLLDSIALPNYENYLYISIEQLDKDVRFLFQFNGIIESITALEEWVMQAEHYPQQTFISEIEANEWQLEALFH